MKVGGRMAPLDRADVDTDQIIPKQFLKRIERTGFGPFLFFDWRQEPSFFLNQHEFDDRMNDAQLRLGNNEIIGRALVIIIALLSLVGLRPRINEFA